MIYPVPELVQDFPHIPAPILMQGLMTCPEHISWYSIGLNFLKTFSYQTVDLLQDNCCPHDISCTRMCTGFMINPDLSRPGAGSGLMIKPDQSHLGTCIGFLIKPDPSCPGTGTGFMIKPDLFRSGTSIGFVIKPDLL